MGGGLIRTGSHPAVNKYKSLLRQGGVRESQKPSGEGQLHANHSLTEWRIAMASYQRRREEVRRLHMALTNRANPLSNEEALS
jgi:hypothetical protein